MEEEVKVQFETVNNKLCYLFSKHLNLKNAKNDEIIDAFRQEFNDYDTASESITRSARKLRSEGFYLANEDVREMKAKKEKEFRSYYGKT